MRVQNKLKVIGVAATVMLSAGSLFSTAIGLAETETVPVESSESFQKIASKEPVTSFSQEVVSESFTSQSSDRMDTEESNTVETEESETTVAEQREVSEEQPEIESKSPKFIQTRDFLVDGESSGITYQGNTLELSGTNALYTVRMNNSGQTTTTDRIEVTGTNVTVKLNGVKIKSSSNAPFLINPGASATVDLIGENELISASDYAGLQNNNTSENSLVITSDSGSYDGYAGKLTARCNGMFGAGIGGGAGGSGEVTINGGHVTATGGTGGAGIGGGDGGNGEVTISGGYVTAIGEYRGAGIGGNGGSGKVTISGGTVQSTGNSSSDIGSGYGVSGGSVTINGGSVKATKNNINPAPTDGSGPVHPYKADGTNYQSNQTVTAMNKDFNVSGKHDGDESFYLYLPENKHVVKVGEKESYIEWKTDQFLAASTYTLTIPQTVELEASDKTASVELKNDFYQVPGYTRQVTAKLKVGSLDNEKYLTLTDTTDASKSIRTKVAWNELRMEAGSEKNENQITFAAPISSIDGEPIRAGNYRGILTFEAGFSN